MSRYLSKGRVMHTLYADGVHDDTEALQAYIDGHPVLCDGQVLQPTDPLPGRCIRINGTVRIRRPINWPVQ
jgi:hypothetical protein